MAKRLLLLLLLAGTALAVGTGIVGAAPPQSPQQSRRHQQQQQIPFLSSYDSPGVKTPAPALHRVCIPSSHHHEEEWTRVLSSLASLQARYPRYELDMWTDAPRPRLRPRSSSNSTLYGQSSEERSCLDFTYPDEQGAIKVLDEALSEKRAGMGMEWEVLADSAQLADRVERDKEGGVNTPAEGAGMGGTTRGVEDHFHNGYHNLANITAWLSWQVFQNPSLAELVELGTTYQEKVIQGIRIGRDAGRGKREVVIVGGAHGREWITTSTCLYLISHLLSASPSTPGSASHLDKFSFLIIPVLNPDGYEHTWGRGSDRFWRKNLQPTGSHDWLGRECKGLDVSRNFPVHFSASSSLTGSGCDSTYPGQEALSSSEARALASYLSRSGEEGEEVLSFIDLHSYGQLILYPWLSCASASSDGYASDNATAATTTTAPPIPDEEDMAELTLGAARAAKLVHNKVYRAGRGCEVMYSQEGSAVDFAYTARRGSAQGGDGGAGIKWSFEVELRDEGSWGFLLPPGQVRDTGEEMAALLDYLLAFVAGKERL